MSDLAVIILTKNEEANIEDCIKSALFADEIIVIDSGSTDKTQVKAEALGAKFVLHPMTEEGFAGQRNFALTQTKAKWVFYLDADERLTQEAGEEIKIIAHSDKKAAYRIKRINVLFGQMMKHGGHAPDWSSRLYPRDSIHWIGKVHEHVETSLPYHDLVGVMHHHTYNDWERYFEKFNQYTTLMADLMYTQGKRASFADILFHPIFAFFRFYILRLGLLDGKQGLIFALNHYFYTMIKYVKLYYKQREEK